MIKSESSNPKPKPFVIYTKTLHILRLARIEDLPVFHNTIQPQNTSFPIIYRVSEQPSSCCGRPKVVIPPKYEALVSPPPSIHEGTFVLPSGKSVIEGIVSTQNIGLKFEIVDACTSDNIVIPTIEAAVQFTPELTLEGMNRLFNRNTWTNNEGATEIVDLLKKWGEFMLRNYVVGNRYEDIKDYSGEILFEEETQPHEVTQPNAHNIHNSQSEIAISPTQSINANEQPILLKKIKDSEAIIKSVSYNQKKSQEKKEEVVDEEEPQKKDEDEVLEVEIIERGIHIVTIEILSHEKPIIQKIATPKQEVIPIEDDLNVMDLQSIAVSRRKNAPIPRSEQILQSKFTTLQNSVDFFDLKNTYNPSKIPMKESVFPHVNSPPNNSILVSKRDDTIKDSNTSNWNTMGNLLSISKRIHSNVNNMSSIESSPNRNMYSNVHINPSLVSTKDKGQMAEDFIQIQSSSGNNNSITDATKNVVIDYEQELDQLNESIDFHEKMVLEKKKLKKQIVKEKITRINIRNNLE